MDPTNLLVTTKPQSSKLEYNKSLVLADLDLGNWAAQSLIDNIASVKGLQINSIIIHELQCSHAILVMSMMRLP